MRQLISAFLSFCLSQAAFSHGFVSQPQSRSYLCNQGGNINCGSIQYEPQSVEGPDGFPAGGAQDGTLGAAGQAAWAPLNEQTADRWKKVPIKSGAQSFSWRLTAAHVTKNFVYYMTKANWNPNEKLTRDSFDLTPFCSLDLAMTKPPADFTHDCVVPERQGYHVILALWDVGDTAATFYQLIDVQFNGTASEGSTVPGPSHPSPPPQGDTGKPADCVGSSPSLLPVASSSTAQLKNCTAVPTSGADNSWCNINCNHTPSFCPANLCSCL